MRANTIGLIVLAACLTTASAASGQDAAAKANRGAYEALRKCYVVNGQAHSTALRAGEAAAADAYKSKARQSFDLAYAAGQRLGFKDEQIDRDLRFTQSIELPKMVQTRAYFLESVATCKAMGLM